jgi:hypothetical protein
MNNETVDNNRISLLNSEKALHFNMQREAVGDL